ncbi:MAG: nucleotidyl transferase AbiEii/AbiGii toxin family protein [Candidatus Omnitrophica bacterium]|nr:nucleotidyl transferase AbiEii/AbiGii toxin family protein [Candidatus Omnitrophota bacterium]
MDYKKTLIHNEKCFEKQELMSRRQKLGFNNLARMELFLWDLEIYLQFQAILKNKIALKGGAAVQFYLPIEYQRTSIDIDLICAIEEEKIKDAVKYFEKRFDGNKNLFKFKLHKPKKPKTDLPLLTYYINVPSSCTDKELFKKISNIQEIKVEFYISKDNLEINSFSTPKLFALESNCTYQILHIDALFGDKLTTMGPNTIGIPQERSDEQIKQIYDIFSLLQFNYKKIDFKKAKKCFIKRAELECAHRKIKFDIKLIFTDILSQLKALSSIDIDKNQELIKLILDFQSLYLRRNISRIPGEWANIGACLCLFLECFESKDCDIKNLALAFSIEETLQFKEIKGIERGNIIRKFKDDFLKEFAKYSKFPPKILKWKDPVRIFWSIVSLKNIDLINLWIDKFKGHLLLFPLFLPAYLLSFP